ncbi:hypothetical protein Pmani_003298 [Petrolisthes manimaculis]|uniref:Uncharacterized protein n=1 Tax=Petrolisthes manimaculis TaxID=1843537 RepID=A0AAE1QIU8_9EUCA|nr:hypothetical protein Pmani_003298 [Petrolisthes manimaculis]
MVGQLSQQQTNTHTCEDDEAVEGGSVDGETGRGSVEREAGGGSVDGEAEGGSVDGEAEGGSVDGEAEGDSVEGKEGGSVEGETGGDSGDGEAGVHILYRLEQRLDRHPGCNDHGHRPYTHQTPQEHSVGHRHGSAGDTVVIKTLIGNNSNQPFSYVEQ